MINRQTTTEATNNTKQELMSFINVLIKAPLHLLVSGLNVGLPGLPG